MWANPGVLVRVAGPTWLAGQSSPEKRNAEETAACQLPGRAFFLTPLTKTKTKQTKTKENLQLEPCQVNFLLLRTKTRIPQHNTQSIQTRIHDHLTSKEPGTLINSRGKAVESSPTQRSPRSHSREPGPAPGGKELRHPFGQSDAKPDRARPRTPQGGSGGQDSPQNPEGQRASDCIS